MPTSAPVLWVFVPEKAGRCHALRAHDTIGRDLNNAIVVEHRSVSRLHARVRCENGQFELVDVGSKNGLRVAGNRVSRCLLEDQQWVALGDVYAQFSATAIDPTAIGERRAQSATWRTGIRVAKRGELLQRICEAFVLTAECQRGMLMLRGETGAMVHATVGDLAPDAGAQSLIARVFEERLPLLLSDVAAAPWARERPSVVLQQLAAIVCVPLLRADTVIGVLYADSAEPGKRFTDVDEELLRAIAEDAALAIAEYWLAAKVDKAFDMLDAS